MGEAADRKVTEIEQTRRQIELDLTELEGRVPAPLRSVKTLVGTVVGSSALAAASGVLMRRLRAKRRKDARTNEVIVRVIREDEAVS